MSNEKIVGKINRFGCEYTIVKNIDNDSCFVQDCHGNEFKLSKPATRPDEDIIENARKLLKSAGL
ncbi:MAG: hypothetical protein DRJ10_14990 [Bacteroidetes bacterium]|nr:MAG: hypothetical protein DRJ10_14990 [Bacteroidota bacterium]